VFEEMKLTCPKCKTILDITEAVEEIERKAIYRFVNRIIEDGESKTKETL
jgi:phage FluMu protein Com